MKKNINKSIFNGSLSQIKDIVEKVNGFVTEQNKTEQGNFIASDGVLDEGIALIEKTASVFAANLNEDSSQLRTAISAVSADLDVELAGGAQKAGKELNDLAQVANDKLTTQILGEAGQKKKNKQSAHPELTQLLRH